MTGARPLLWDDFFTKPEGAGVPLPPLCLGAMALVWRLAPCQWFDVAPEAALWKLAARPPGPQGFLFLSGVVQRKLCGPLLAGESRGSRCDERN